MQHIIYNSANTSYIHKPILGNSIPFPKYNLKKLRNNLKHLFIVIQDKESELYGLMDINQKIIVDAKYRGIIGYNSNMVVLENNGEFTGFNRSGTEIFKINGLTPIGPDNDHGFVNIGNETYGDKFGLMDSLGNIVLEPIYRDLNLGQFPNYIYAEKLDSQYVFDYAGTKILETAKNCELRLHDGEFRKEYYHHDSIRIYDQYDIFIESKKYDKSIFRGRRRVDKLTYFLNHNKDTIRLKSTWGLKTKVWGEKVLAEDEDKKYVYLFGNYKIDTFAIIDETRNLIIPTGYTYISLGYCKSVP